MSNQQCKSWLLLWGMWYTVAASGLVPTKHDCIFGCQLLVRCAQHIRGRLWQSACRWGWRASLTRWTQYSFTQDFISLFLTSHPAGNCDFAKSISELYGNKRTFVQTLFSLVTVCWHLGSIFIHTQWWCSNLSLSYIIFWGCGRP